jgi:hypothetical protein
MAPGTLSNAAYIKYLKLGFLKVPKAVTTTQQGRNSSGRKWS